ncbi:MAG: TetR/AcrR family transcriptional regulator [bacterium]|nr:TetR/AcrR family transcriptional regulator [bacterium]
MHLKKSADKKQRIIDAAIKLISEKGYHGATTALIAKEAGVSQGIIFHYFKNKEDLFYSLLKEKSKIFTQELKKCIADKKNALEKIEAVVLIYAKVVKKEEKFYEILIKQTKGSGLDFDKINKYGLMECFVMIGNL